MMGIALPPDPVLWAVVVISGVFAVAFVLESIDGARTIRRGWKHMVRRDSD